LSMGKCRRSDSNWRP